MNLIEQIEDQLKFKHHMPDGAVTRAIAYVVFNRYSMTLVHTHDVTREMAYEATRGVIRLANEAQAKVMPPRDPRTLLCRYHSLSGINRGRFTEVKRELWLYPSLKQAALDAWHIGLERGYNRGQVTFKIVN